jgi:hypothetical protein
VPPVRRIAWICHGNMKKKIEATAIPKRSMLSSVSMDRADGRYSLDESPPFARDVRGTDLHFAVCLPGPRGNTPSYRRL